MSFMRMCYGWACLAGLCKSNHLSCCEFRHLVVFFLSTVSFVCSETCFPRIYYLNILLGYVGSVMWSSWLTLKKIFNIMSVALLAISYFGTLILLSCNIDPPVKFLIVIILVVQEIYFVSQE